MNDPTRLQHFSQVFGSDIKNHDYSHQNNLILNGNSSSRKPSTDFKTHHTNSRTRAPSYSHPSPKRTNNDTTASPPRMSSPHKVVYQSSRISMINNSGKLNEPQAHSHQHPPVPFLQQQQHRSKSQNWLDFIPPLPGDDISSENLSSTDKRKSKPAPSLIEFQKQGLGLPSHYKQIVTQSGTDLPADNETYNGGLLPAQQVSNSDPSLITSNRKPRKTCAKCSNPIAGQFVRAMGMTYHIDCFRCTECNQPCSSKFFPSEQVINGEKIQVPLCEYDYFKNLDLICYNCNQALRGSYITAIGHKYHLEHFTCVICSKVFETDESFYEHDKGIYCHYHYSKLFAKHCESCNTPILKQFIEVFKGGRYQQWHPECFMCYRFWNVLITVDCLNPSQIEIDNFSIDLSLISKIWSTLSTYEEDVASYIIAMLEFGINGNQAGGLNIAAKLVLKAECLFKAFDAINDLQIEDVLQKVRDEEHNKITSIDGEQNYVPLKTKYVALQNKPRNFSAKLMSYLAFLKKNSANSGGGFDSSGVGVSKRLISIITGLANYLKLIVTCGLTNVLEYNRIVHSQVATDRFLKEISNHSNITNKTDAFQTISPLVPVSSTDSCFHCMETIEEQCVRFNKANSMRWHLNCLKCGNCRELISERNLQNAAFSVNSNRVLCASCTGYLNDPSCQYGFEYVSKLMQIVYISEIALVRVKYVIEKNSQNDRNIEKRPNDTINSEIVTNIKRMKSSRQQEQQHNKSAAGVFRKSTILNAPLPNTAGMANQDDITDNKKSLHLYDNSKLEIQEDDGPDTSASATVVTNLLRGGRLALDDIHRIVSAEETRQLLPNAFKHARNLPLNKEDNAVTKYIGKTTGGNSKVAGSKQASAPRIGKYYSELSTEEHFIIRHISIIALMKVVSATFTVEKLLELIPTRKQQTFWTRIKGSGKKSNYKGPKVFGAPLEELTEKYGTDSEKAVGPKVVTIPAFIEDCLAALRQKDMSVEGIFRKNGNIRRLRELTEAINEHPEKLPDFDNETQIQLSALMKKFLREMPDPLFTFKLYELWIESQKYDDTILRKRILKLVISILPKCNRDLLEVLFSFFNWVASFSYIDENTGSKMNSHNLATVLAPNVLYKKPTNEPATTAGQSGASILRANTEAGDGYLLSIEVLNVLIDNHAEFATVPSDIMEAYNTLLKEDPTVGASGDNNGKGALTSKEIITKIETMLEAHPDILKNDSDAVPDEMEEADSTVTPTVIQNMNQLEVGKNAVIDAHD
ncbi:GTPase-activating protein [Saccharomycopsis crataegensis]|uniref:GTPase-activating protein n=1 Tax=Saccharomycopsis crataegensis TaxID=43959 RepID=A0AAV5QIR3_9ASCO|nr:GTPase-activating protein [Saccharomycopsis crataegensis]